LHDLFSQFFLPTHSNAKFLNVAKTLAGRDATEFELRSLKKKKKENLNKNYYALLRHLTPDFAL